MDLRVAHIAARLLHPFTHQVGWNGSKVVPEPNTMVSATEKGKGRPPQSFEENKTDGHECRRPQSTAIQIPTVNNQLHYTVGNKVGMQLYSLSRLIIKVRCKQPIFGHCTKGNRCQVDSQNALFVTTNMLVIWDTRKQSIGIRLLGSADRSRFWDIILAKNGETLNRRIENDK